MAGKQPRDKLGQFASTGVSGGRSSSTAKAGGHSTMQTSFGEDSQAVHSAKEKLIEHYKKKGFAAKSESQFDARLTKGRSEVNIGIANHGLSGGPNSFRLSESIGKVARLKAKKLPSKNFVAYD
jgi:hypothetical protein